MLSEHPSEKQMHIVSDSQNCKSKYESFYLATKYNLMSTTHMIEIAPIKL